MNRSCFVYDRENGEKMDENAQIPLAQPNRIRFINKRTTQGDDRPSMTAIEFAELNGNNQPLLEDKIKIRMSSDVASQLMCHGNSAAYNTLFSITKNEENKILRLSTEWKDWAKYDDDDVSEDQRKISAEIGRLAEEAISTRGAGAVSVQSGFASSNGNCVRLVEREIDTVYLNGREKYEPAEVKCVGQLTMSKVKLFNTRLFPIVTKAIASQNGATFMVVRDDREMDLWNTAKTDSERMPILEIMFWENVARLLPLTDFVELKAFHGSLCCTLEENYNNINNGEIKNGAENIKFCVEKGKPKRMLSCKANIPKFSNNPEKGNKQMKQIVIVGPNIPYFEFRLSDLYMIYKHKHKKPWYMNRYCTNVLIIAKTMEDLMNMFRTYSRHQNQQQLDITFLTEEIFNKKNVSDKFGNDKITPERFTSFDDLGAILYKDKLTYWEKPVPACLLLLGKGQHIPIKMITSRLSFGSLHEGITGINLSDCVEPELIAIIGTKEECKIGNELIKKEFPNSTIHNFCPESKIDLQVDADKMTSNTYLPVKEDGLTFITCLPQNLDAAMKEFSFPMYKDFRFNRLNDTWVAE